MSASRVISKIPDLSGERWRPLEGWPIMVSNMGRVKGGRGGLLKVYVFDDRPRVRPMKNGDLKTRRAFSLGSLVLHVFKGEPVGQPTHHLNGDLMDCRLANLKPDRARVRFGGYGADFPWTPEQDRLLRRAKTVQEVIDATGHSSWHVRARMRDLGIPRLVRKQPRKPLADRDLSAIGRAVEVLEAANISDHDINLALGIRGEVNRGQGGINEAQDRCLVVLHNAGFTRPELIGVMGWTYCNVAKRILALGLVESQYERGSRTKNGPPEPIAGELWRPHPWGYQISNMGPLVGKTGHLLSTIVNSQGNLTVALRRPDGTVTSGLVASLVLAAFKPDLPYSPRRKIFLNGDRLDCRLANVVPQEAVEGLSGANDRDRARLWADAVKTVPGWMEPETREDLISDMVVIMIEGRARTMADAFKLARKEHNAMTGAFRERSLDAPLAGTEDLSLLDMITSEGGFYQPSVRDTAKE